MAENSEPEIYRLRTRAETAAALRISMPTLDRMHAAGIGPRRVKLSKRRVGYRQADIEAWLQATEQEAA